MSFEREECARIRPHSRAVFWSKRVARTEMRFGFSGGRIGNCKSARGHDLQQLASRSVSACSGQCSRRLIPSRTTPDLPEVKDEEVRTSWRNAHTGIRGVRSDQFTESDLVAHQVICSERPTTPGRHREPNVICVTRPGRRALTHVRRD